MIMMSPAIGGPFAMTAHDGHAVTNGDLEGRPYVVFFGYTHCPGFCPTALFAISEAFKAMGPDKKIAALFSTVDPARDTPETLKSYLENFDSRIIGLTGDSAKIQAVTKAFKVYVEKVPGENGDYTVDHYDRLSHGQAWPFRESLQSGQATEIGRGRAGKISAGHLEKYPFRAACKSDSKNLFEFDHRERVRWGNWISLI
jgi:SCO1/SenC family protein